MKEALELLGDFGRDDIDWMIAHGDEQQIISGTEVTQEGVFPDALYVVLEGLLGIRVATVSQACLATLGPGEIVGEISFIEGTPATATVFAVENTLLLALSRAKLGEHCRADPAFAARLYHSFARLVSRRLCQRVGTLGHVQREKTSVAEVHTGAWATIAKPLEAFKTLLEQADEAALKNDGEIPADLAVSIQRGFQDFCELMNDEIGDSAPLPQLVKEELGARVKREMLPYLLLTQTAERFYSKPRGYAGDFKTIDLIYRDEPQGTGRVGALLDRCFLDTPASEAVRNRRGLLAEEILRAIEARIPERTHVTTLACGPAQEVFDVYEKLGDPNCLNSNLLDIDLQALAFVGDKRDTLKLKRHMNLVNANLVYLALGKQKLDLPPQDLVYSIGLIDYFNDKFVIGLMNYIHSLLRPGGKIILGNFHPNNSTKVVMDYILDWKLIHRSEDDMDRLFAASLFARKSTRIRFEARGVNLFAECVK